MSKLRVHCFCISLDGYGAGPDQSVDAGLGVGGESLHEWMFETKGGREMIGQQGGSEGVDNDFFNAGVAGGGERLFDPDQLGSALDNYDVADFIGNPKVTHLRLTKK
jgi:hypothetical protein